jgi:hypothetical protein
MKNTQSTASYILSFSCLSLAGALVYFTYVLTGIVAEIPRVVGELSSVVTEVKTIVVEVEKIQVQVPLILEESARIRAQIAPFPKILTNGVNTINKALGEVDKSRLVLKSFTEEIDKTRREIPSLIKSADKLVSHAEKAGENLGQGAAIGAVTGIIESPFDVVDDLARKIYGLTEKDAEKKSNGDFKLIEQAALKACHSVQVGTVIEWGDLKTPHHGTVTLKSIQDNQQRQCRTIAVDSKDKAMRIKHDELTLCRKADDPWYIQK